jgi:hypothetical protein
MLPTTRPVATIPLVSLQTPIIRACTYILGKGQSLEVPPGGAGGISQRLKSVDVSPLLRWGIVSIYFATPRLIDSDYILNVVETTLALSNCHCGYVGTNNILRRDLRKPWRPLRC